MSLSFAEKCRLTWRNGIRYLPLLKNLISRELKKKYRQSVLGYVWCVLNPLLVMLIIRLAMRLFKGALDTVHLGIIDKAGGSLLFMFKYAFVLSIVLNLLYAYNPDLDTFGTKHMMNNKPYEFTLDLMPRVLGSEKMPSDSLKLYRDLIEPVPID